MKQKIKKILLIVLTTIMLAPTASVYADAPTQANHELVLTAQNKIAEESIALLYLSNYYNCIEVRNDQDYADQDHPYSFYRNPGNNNWWDDPFAVDHGPFHVGYWFETELGATNDTIDGQAYCQEYGELQQKVADLLTDGNVDRLLCGEDIYDPNGGGIIYNKKAGSDSHFCGSMDDDNHRVNVVTGYNKKWKTWFESLFAAKAASAGWTDFTIDDVENRYFNGIVGYYLYRQELVYKCGGEPQIATSLPSGYQVTDPLKVVSEDGGIDDGYFQTEFSFKHGFVDRMNDTMCKTVVGFANEDEKYAAYRNRVLEIFNDDCKTYYNNEIASLGDDASDEAKAKIDELNASTALNPWLEEKEASRQSMQCVTIPDMEKPAEVVDNPTDIATEEACNDATSEECREKACYKAAGSLGWVICPAIFTTRDAVNGIYSGVIEPLLMVDPTVVASLGTNDSPTYKIWATFRNIANILFAIALLAVILSQVTGFGIDNYGIKKILPKLIVTAILVNLSLIICGVLVDAFNLLGGGIKQLFDTLSSNVNADWLTEFTNDSDPTLTRVNVIGTVLSYVLGLLVVGGGAAVGVGLYNGGIALSSLIIPLLLLVLSGVIAAFFAFVILGARQALIIIMIAISPLAFVLYALPNTQGIFKKWVKIFEGLLIVYPAASLMIGGGYLASRLILSNIDANPFMAMIAGLVSIVPYFMIPKLTSKSMDAIGGIGNAINGISRGSRSRATNGINNSEAVKRRRQAGIDAARTRNANRYLNSRRGKRDLAAMKNGDNVSRARRARLANALQNSNSDYETSKGILDAAQTRDDINTGNLARVDNFKRQQGHLDIDDKAAHIGALTQAAEMERMDANNTRAFADNNDSAAIEAEAIALAGAGLGDAANLSRYNAAMNRLAKIDPSAYRRAMDGSIAATNAANAYGANVDPVRAAAEAQATRQAIKDNAIANSDIAKEQGLKGLIKANAANNLDTADAYTQQQAGSSVKDMLNLDDDYVARLAGQTINPGTANEQPPIATNQNIKDTARMALEAMAANPKMAEDKKAEYLNNLVRIATDGTQDNYAQYQAQASQDLVHIDTSAGRLSIDRHDIPNGDAKQIDPTRSHADPAGGTQIVFKDGSEYNTRTKVFTPSHNPGSGTGGTA